jgi:hypothetical protein
MGSKIFTKGAWDTSLCSDYRNAQTAYNKVTAPKDGTPYKTCTFFNTYMLYLQHSGKQPVAQGQYCSLFTEAWTEKYATNSGQWRGNDRYVVTYSFNFSKLDAGVSPLVGDANGAAYQAVADIKWSSPAFLLYISWLHHPSCHHHCYCYSYTCRYLYSLHHNDCYADAQA